MIICEYLLLTLVITVVVLVVVRGAPNGADRLLVGQLVEDAVAPKRDEVVLWPQLERLDLGRVDHDVRVPAKLGDLGLQTLLTLCSRPPFTHCRQRFCLAPSKLPPSLAAGLPGRQQLQAVAALLATKAVERRRRVSLSRTHR